MTKTVAVFGGSFNPPGLHHQKIVRALSAGFDQVVVVPCGPRPDKPNTPYAAPLHRATMADLAFSGLENVRVDLFDLEQASFTRTHELEQRYASEGEVWLAMGADLLQGAGEGLSRVHQEWEHGDKIWTASKIAVLTRPEHPLSAKDLPMHHRLIDVEAPVTSASVRERLFRGESCANMLHPKNAEYIKRYGLYVGAPPRRTTQLSLDAPRLMIVKDDRNAKACAWAERFAHLETEAHPDLILVLGGDGTMLHAIQEHWRERVPFVGVNAGHLGFLLNDEKHLIDRPFPLKLVLRQLPLLYVEADTVDGRRVEGISFNDAWVERASGQTAWLQVEVDGQVRLPKLVCDGALVSTAAGSTAYARAMGATPLLADTQAWLLVGSNVMQPFHWKSALLSMESEVQIRAMHSSKRPVNGFLYGVPLGQVERMGARISRIAAVELGFAAEHDMAEKIARIQFPQGE